MIETPSPTTAAFTGSESHIFDGVKLHPFTPQRAVASQTMGRVYPFIGKDGLEQFNRTGLYPGMVKDIVIVLWLCSVNHEEVDMAEGAPREAYQKALTWAAEKNIHNVESDEHKKAVEMFFEILNEVKNSQTKPSQTTESDEEFPNE